MAGRRQYGGPYTLLKPQQCLEFKVPDGFSDLVWKTPCDVGLHPTVCYAAYDERVWMTREVVHQGMSSVSDVDAGDAALLFERISAEPFQLTDNAANRRVCHGGFYVHGH